MASTERIIIQVNGQGIRTVSRNFRALGLRAGSASSQVGLLQKAIGAVGATLVARNFLKIADSINQMENRLKIVTFGVGNLNDVFEELVEVSNRSRSALEGSVELFARVALSVRDLGLAQKEILQFTESVNKAIIVSGANAREANAGIIQLAQGLASGALRGDELRSVLEQLPFVADVIAKEFGLLRGELRKFAETGQLVTGRILKAFRDQREEIEEQFQKTIPTLAQAYVQLQTRTAAFIRGLDDSTKITETLVKGLQRLTAELDTVANAAIKIGIIIGTVFAAAALLKFLALVKSIGFALAFFIVTNPISVLLLAIGVGLAAAVGAVIAFRREITVTSDGLADIGDVVVVAFRKIKPALEAIVNVASEIVKSINEAFQGLDIDLEKTIANSIVAFANMGIKILETINLVRDTLASEEVKQIKRSSFFFPGFVDNPDREANVAQKAADKILQTISFGFIKSLAEIKKEAENFDFDAPPGNRVSLGIADQGIKELTQIRDAAAVIAKGITDEIRAQGEVRRAAQEAAAGPSDQELFASLQKRGQTLSMLRDQAVPLGEDFLKLADSIFKADEASRKLAEGQEVIQAAFKNREISFLTAIASSKALEEQTKAARQPLQKFLEELQTEREILSLNGIERDRAIERIIAEVDIRKKLPGITQENLDLLLEEIDLNETIRKQAQIRDGIFQQFVQTQLDVNESLVQFNVLVADGILKGEALRRAFVSIQREALLLQNTIGSGIRLALLDFGDSVDRVAETVAAGLTNVFSNLENTLVDFFITGEAGFRQFAISILAEITRVIIRLTVLKALMASLNIITGAAATSVISAGETIPLEPLVASGGRAVNVPVLFGAGSGQSVVETTGAPRRQIENQAVPIGSATQTIVFKQGDIEINVESGGGGDTGEGNLDLAQQIGKQIRNETRSFVQDILVDESRPGGILNRFVSI